MKYFIRWRAIIMLKLDFIAGAIALCLMLLVRYGVNDFYAHLLTHAIPFFIVVCVFTASFYIFNLYSTRFNNSITDFNDSFIKSIIVSFSLSIIIFYIYGNVFELTPKTNLFIFTTIFSLIDFYIRILVRRQYSSRKINRKVLIINTSNNPLINEIKSNQTMGYEVIGELDTFNHEEILKINPDIVIVDTLEGEAFESLYELFKKDISIYTIELFYEETFQKIPTETVDKNKIIEYINKNKGIFISLKRLMDVVLSVSFLIILSPVFILLAGVVKTTSKGPVFIRQKRVGKNDIEFILFKFRSMYATDPDGQSEGGKVIWTSNDKTDSRITPTGRILRKSHLDEIPQLFNILIGDLSLVGPRPERPEFTNMLNKEIKYYDLRHSVKPGLTGWAQINYRYGASVEDTKEKLKYDLYYIKNRNIFLDILIIVKTIAMVLKKY